MSGKSIPCSTTLPTILRRILTLSEFWMWPVGVDLEKGKDGDASGLQEAGGDIDVQAAADVVDRCLAASAQIHPIILHQPAGVASRPRQRDAKRAGQRGLLPAGIGRAVLSGVAHHGMEAVARPGAWNGNGRGDDQQTGKARGDQIQQIVEACRRPAEGKMARCLWPIMLSAVLMVL